MLVRAGAGPISFRLLPKKEKKKKRVRLSSYSYRRHQKRLEKDRAGKKTEKKKKKKSGDESTGELISLFDKIKLGIGMLPELSRRIRTRIKRFSIRVGGPDAAAVGKRFGLISGAAGLLFEALDEATRLKPLSPGQATVTPDFCSEELSAQLDLVFSIPVGSVLAVGLIFLIRFAKLKSSKSAALS